MQTKQTVLAVILIAVLLIVLALINAWLPTPVGQKNVSLTSSTAQPPSPQVLHELEQSPTFQYVVSYTDQGFQPSTLTVKKGATVRFSNNSSNNLWIASFGTASHQIYPGTSVCGGSSFDSCESLSRGDFWQFTFNETGVWEFKNNAVNSVGTIVVQ